MRIALYCRVSTEEQARHGLSIDTQLDNLRQWAEQEGHTIINEYIDAGVSARKSPLKRPALQRLLADLDSFDAVAFTRLDRWSRNIKGYHMVQEQLEQHHVAWIAIQEDFETLSSSGRFKVNIMLSINEAESDRTGDRLRVIMERKAALGEHLGPKPPLGYSVVNKHFVLNEQAEIVRECFRVYQTTGSITAAMRYLHSQGIPYIYNTVDRLLRNELYAGRHRGNPNYCPPLLPPDEFNAIQVQLRSRSVRTNPTNREYILSGMVFCAVCGKRYSGVYRANLKEHNRYQYRCNYHFLDHLCPNRHMIKESEVEDYLLSRLEQEVRKMVGEVITKPRPKRPDNSQKLKRLTDLYVDGLISKEEFLSRRDALTFPPDPKPTDYSQLREIVLDGDFRTEYGNLTRTERRALWRSVVDRIEVGEDEVVVTFLP